MKRLLVAISLILLLSAVFSDDTPPAFIPFRKGNKWGFCDSNKTIVIPFDHDATWPFDGNLATVRKDNRMGCIDVKGRVLVPPQYNLINRTEEGCCRRVMLNGKWGSVDVSGKEITPIKYDSTSPFQDGLALVKLDGQYGYIDRCGTEYWKD